ncbi:MAG: hypothetical protein V1487_04700 [bacterium]
MIACQESTSRTIKTREEYGTGLLNYRRERGDVSFCGPLDPRILTGFTPPERWPGETTSKTVLDLPTIFITGALSSPAQWEVRDGEANRIAKQTSFNSVQAYMQFTLYGDLGIGSNSLAAGKGFATLLGADAISLPGQAGLFSLAEIVLAEIIGMQRFPKGYIPDARPILRRELSQETIAQLTTDNTSVLERMYRLRRELEPFCETDLDYFVSRYDTSTIDELANTTYWQYIVEFLNNAKGVYLSDIDWVQRRLCSPLASFNFVNLQTKQPDLSDYRLVRANVDGINQTVRVNAFECTQDNQPISFHHIGADGKVYLCRRVSDTEDVSFVTVSEVVWEGI